MRPACFCPLFDKAVEDEHPACFIASFFNDVETSVKPACSSLRRSKELSRESKTALFRKRLWSAGDRSGDFTHRV